MMIADTLSLTGSATVNSTFPNGRSPLELAVSVSVAPSSAVLLSGTVTDSALPQGDTISTTWSEVSGPGTVTILNSNTTGSGQIGTWDTTATANGTYWITLR